jgi:hypothetical protein
MELTWDNPKPSNQQRLFHPFANRALGQVERVDLARVTASYCYDVQVIVYPFDDPSPLSNWQTKGQPLLATGQIKDLHSASAGLARPRPSVDRDSGTIWSKAMGAWRFLKMSRNLASGCLNYIIFTGSSEQKKPTVRGTRICGDIRHINRSRALPSGPGIVDKAGTVRGFISNIRFMPSANYQQRAAV